MLRRFAFLTLATLLLPVVNAAPAYAAFQEDVTLSSSVRETASGGMIPLELLALDPATSLDRATFTALAVAARYSTAEIDRCFWDIASSVPPRFTRLFRDVTVDHPLAKHLCIALRDGIARGYGDGSFRPAQRINAAEASKIIARAFSLAPFSDGFSHDPWYWPYVQSLAARNAIPPSIDRLDHTVAMADFTEMKTRLEGGITWRPGRSMEELLPQIAERTAPTGRLAARAAPPSLRVKFPPLPSASTGEESLKEPNTSSADARDRDVGENKKKWWNFF